MVKRFTLVLTALSLIFVLFGCGASEKITILHFNDFHAQMLPFMETVKKDGEAVKGEDGKDLKQDVGGGIARLARAIADRKDDATIVAFGGDMLQGTPFSSLFLGQDGFEIMNEFVDVSTLGNHEFDYGQENLKKLLGLAKFPVVCANVSYQDGELFTGKAYIIKEIKGIKIGIFGMVTEETVVTTHPNNVIGLTFEKPALAARRMVEELRENQQVDIVVAISHTGSDEDAEMVKEVDGIDVLIGGHSHTPLTNGNRVNETLIAQAGFYGKYLGEITLEVDPESKKLKSSSAKLIPMTGDLPLDEGIQAQVAEYAKKLDGEIKQVIARAPEKLEGEKSKARNQETNLGNYICDVTLELSKADLAVYNGGGIRASIEAGDVTVEDVMNVLPFDNTIVVVDLPGSEIVKMFDKSAGKEREKGNFLQISKGSSYTIRDKKAVDIVIAGAPVDPARIYKVATSDFLSAGGDGFDEFKSGSIYDTGNVMRDAVIEYIRAAGVIQAEVDGRIKGIVE